MDSSHVCTPFEAARFIPGRLSFSQILLVTTYVFLRSCFLYQIGGDRQILDILRREGKDWEPRIGSDGLSKLISCNHNARNPGMDRIWEGLRSVLIQDHHHLRVSARDLRQELRYILIKLRQISAEGFNTITDESQRPPRSKTPFGSTKTMVLLCFSLSVVPSEPLSPVHWELDDSTIKDMIQHLNQSPLFPDGVDVNELRTTLSSLEILFSCEDERFHLFQTRAATDDLGPGTETRQVHTWRYESYQVLQTHNIEGSSSDRGKSYLGLDVEGFEENRMNRHVFG